MRNLRMLALGASLLVLAGACGMGGGSQTATPGPAVRIGSAGFPESALMAEIYAQVLEAHGYDVQRQLQLGPRPTTFPSLAGGEIDLMPEYIGSLLEFVTEGAGEATADPEATYQRLQERLGERNLTALGYTPAQDKNAWVVRGDTAEEHGLTQMTDLSPVQHELTWGLPPECEVNPLCAGALREAYGIEFNEIRVVELGACGPEIASALNGGAVDVGQLCSTQADIERFGFVVLEDDAGTQPAENIAPVARDEWLVSAGGAEAVAAILDPVSAALTTEDLTRLNFRVEVDQEHFDVVARDWLNEHGLLPGN